MIPGKRFVVLTLRSSRARTSGEGMTGGNAITKLVKAAAERR